MTSMNKSAYRALKLQQYPKFAATVDEQGTPNVIPLLSATLADADTAIFARMMIWKTARNLEANSKITLACIGPWFKAFYAKGRFKGYQTSGEYVEIFSQSATFRYNAYMGATHVGIIELEEVGGPLPLHPLKSLLATHKLKQTGNGQGPMPRVIQDKFNRKLGAKFLGWVDQQGFPMALPVDRLSVIDQSTLSFPIPDHNTGPADGSLVAASVLTTDPVAYQVKGRFEINGTGTYKTGLIRVQEVFSAAPPRPGEKIYPKQED